ncbi:hypothetical protein FF38_00998 [Lucilia cuprina]|uniref:Uncharacterized protein n=1 Tax=Lucilia cuprina TaxID=7375 RepID=A0A0L0BXG8_LUCCU|nr:hypothetical protein FF38_00998 [Lucilia cuprina]
MIGFYVRVSLLPAWCVIEGNSHQDRHHVLTICTSYHFRITITVQSVFCETFATGILPLLRIIRNMVKFKTVVTLSERNKRFGCRFRKGKVHLLRRAPDYQHFLRGSAPGSRRCVTPSGSSSIMSTKKAPSEEQIGNTHRWNSRKDDYNGMKI